MGGGPPKTYKARFTGYVPVHPVKAPLTMVGIQAVRWTGYSMPRPITLGSLGIEAAVTPWFPTNRVRILQLGTSAWINYQYNGTNWYKVSAPAVPVDPAIPCGTGIVFLRAGPPDPTDTLVSPTWYFHPPNAW